MEHRGAKIQVDVEEYTRGGYKSDSVLLILHSGRRITPYECRIKKEYQFTLDGLFKIMYSENLKVLIPQFNLISSVLFPKSEPSGDLYCVPVSLTWEHGLGSKNE